ncbi:MAG: DUF459 domain-containing protein [Acidimicrobiales bacterium]|jgi:hypothetical protein
MSSPRARARPVLTAVGALALSLVLSACGSVRTGGSKPTSSSKPPASATSSTTSPSTSSSSTTTTEAPVQPVDGKVTVLDIGDSLGIDLGWGLQWALTDDSSVNLVQDAHGDSGLANTSYYDWPAVLETELQSTHPQVLVVFLGGNDSQNFYQGDQYESFGTPQWRVAYGDRVASMMTEATAAGARVLWVGMPIMGPSSGLSANMATIDSVFRSEAAAHTGVTYLSSWSLFSTPSGQFNGGDTDVAGTEMPLRDPDGVHLADGGEDLLGLTVLNEMKALYKLP